ncbi:MAG TPA: cupredoxin family copper-binding protein [Candidatus Binatia bacterium]|nr:cupredoxin family copper-binding protein [Candidatus Binatia bacterium]
MTRTATLRRAFLLGLMSVLGASLAGAGTRKEARVAVSIENYSFAPDPITIAAGTTVVWTNRDEVTHNLVSRDRLFASPDLEANQHFEFTFHKRGTFDYFCSIHPEMTGRVIVK